MTIRIELLPDEEQALRELARESGRDVAEYVHLVLKAHLEKSKTFAEILAPVWQGFRDSGMTEDEASGLLENDVAAARRERKGRP